MAETSEATHALIDYLDALLTEDARSPAVAEQGAVLKLLCFSVAGLPMAVAAEEVTAVVEESNPTAAVVGEFRYNDRTLILLDARRLILPLGHPARRQPPQGGQVLIMARHALALRCDHTGNTEAIRRDDIAWRDQRGTRPWLLGMARDRALLDPVALLESARGH